MKRIKYLLLTVIGFSLFAVCSAGEDYGGVASLCHNFYIMNPNGTQGKFTTQSRRIGNDRHIVIKNSQQTYTFSSNSGSFIKQELWLRSPFPDGAIIYTAEKDCLLVMEFYTSAPPAGDQYWTEMKMFVDGKLLPESSFAVKLEEKFNFLPKIRKKVPYKYTRKVKNKKKTETRYRNVLVAKKIKSVPSSTQGGVLVNSYRRVLFTKPMKKGESFQLHFEVKAIAEIQFEQEQN